MIVKNNINRWSNFEKSQPLIEKKGNLIQPVTHVRSLTIPVSDVFYTASPLASSIHRSLSPSLSLSFLISPYWFLSTGVFYAASPLASSIHHSLSPSLYLSFLISPYWFLSTGVCCHGRKHQGSLRFVSLHPSCSLLLWAKDWAAPFVRSCIINPSNWG